MEEWNRKKYFWNYT